MSFRNLLLSVVVNGLLFGTSNLFAQSSQSVTLAWDPSPSSSVASYVVRYGTTSGAYAYATNVGNQTSARIVGIQPGLTYFFAVAARDTAGVESVPSNEVSYQVPISNPSPVIALTSPTSGVSYTAPAMINCAASVTANGHTIAKVQFYNGATLLSEDSTAPYNFIWNNVSAGSYSLTARAVYNSTGTVASVAANVFVAPPPSLGLTFAADSGTISAPFVASAGLVYQTAHTTLANSGRAAYNFAIANSGDYLVSAIVDAPDEGANSLFVNIDAEPSDPFMVWHIPPTTGLQGRIVSWQGDGSFDGSEFTGKVFTLTAGTHQLIVRGREGGTKLGTITITRVTTSTPPSIALSSPAANASFTAPATINCAANVTANGQAITKVQFFNGSTLLGEDSTAPYNFIWNNVSAGSYSLTARAVYNSTGTVASVAANVFVANPPPPSLGLTFAADSGTISAPFVASAGLVYQTAHTTLANSGRAAYNFAIANSGDYLVSAIVDAPDEGANSLFVNIDAEPSDPFMVWHIPPTTGLQGRIVSWQGDGSFDGSEFTGKVFTLTAGTHQLIVRGREGGTKLGTITITRVTTSTPPSIALGLPAPWQSTDIGTTQIAGSASHSNGTFTVKGAGKIGGTADSFQFVYQPLSADGEIKARLNFIGDDGLGRVVGLMTRESLAPNARYAFMGVGQNLRYRWQRRVTTAGSTWTTTSSTSSPPDAWLRLQRINDTLYGFRSSDGTNWTQIGSRSIAMATNIYIGLVVTSGDTNTLNTSVFSTMTVVP